MAEPEVMGKEERAIRNLVLGNRYSLRARWTGIGLLAIPLWATWPLLAVWSKTVPLFQFLAIIFAVGASTLALVRPRQSANTRPKTRIVGALMVSLGIFVSDVLYLLAIRIIPAAEANLLLYLWPIMVVVLGGLLSLLAVGRWQVAGVIVGLAGAALVIGAVPGGDALSGTALALSGGLAWAAYLLFRMWQGPEAPDALIEGFWLSAAVALCLHLVLETTVMPDPLTALCTLLVGMLPLALGNAIWDAGLRHGDRAVMATMAYATPMVATLFLVIAGEARVTLGLVLGGMLVAAAGVLAARPSSKNDG